MCTAKIMTTPIHVPVLLDEVIQGISLPPHGVYLDGTLGNGGHAKAVFLSSGKTARIIGIDRDSDALLRAQKTLAEAGAGSALCLEGNYREMRSLVATHGITTVDAILLDLGISSPQLDVSGRGFSFRFDEPLLMTMQKNPDETTITARDVVNNWSEESLSDIIYGFGEERFARRIARAIVDARKDSPIETTFDLIAVIERAVPASYRHGRTHYATKTFQAIRIAVNDELRALEEGLRAAYDLLAPGGALAVITFHSLEDRIVKRCFKQFTEAGFGKSTTKKPILPSEQESKTNPRARSAKLRIFKKN